MIRLFVAAKLSRSDGTQWVFFSGLIISLSANLLINALTPRPLPSNSHWLIAISICLVLASMCFALMGWTLQQFEYIARSEHFLSVEDRTVTKQRLVSASFARLLTIVLIGTILLLLGMTAMIFQPEEQGSLSWIEE
jgi:hypothetical protein